MRGRVHSAWGLSSSGRGGWPAVPVAHRIHCCCRGCAQVVRGVMSLHSPAVIAEWGPDRPVWQQSLSSLCWQLLASTPDLTRSMANERPCTMHTWASWQQLICPQAHWKCCNATPHRDNVVSVSHGPESCQRRAHTAGLHALCTKNLAAKLIHKTYPYLICIGNFGIVLQLCAETPARHPRSG